MRMIASEVNGSGFTEFVYTVHITKDHDLSVMDMC